MNDGFLGLFVVLERPNEMIECTFTFTLVQHRCRKKLVVPALCGQGKNRQRTALSELPERHLRAILQSMDFGSGPCRVRRTCASCARVHVSTGYTELMGCHHIGPTRESKKWAKEGILSPQEGTWAISLKPASTTCAPSA
jgi:hypothetical protein